MSCVAVKYGTHHYVDGRCSAVRQGYVTGKESGEMQGEAKHPCCKEPCHTISMGAKVKVCTLGSDNQRYDRVDVREGTVVGWSRCGSITKRDFRHSRHMGYQALSCLPSEFCLLKIQYDDKKTFYEPAFALGERAWEGVAWLAFHWLKRYFYQANNRDTFTNVVIEKTQSHAQYFFRRLTNSTDRSDLTVGSTVSVLQGKLGPRHRGWWAVGKVTSHDAATGMREIEWSDLAKKRYRKSDPNSFSVAWPRTFTAQQFKEAWVYPGVFLSAYPCDIPQAKCPNVSKKVGCRYIGGKSYRLYQVPAIQYGSSLTMVCANSSAYKVGLINIFGVPNAWATAGQTNRPNGFFRVGGYATKRIVSFCDGKTTRRLALLQRYLFRCVMDKTALVSNYLRAQNVRDRMQKRMRLDTPPKTPESYRSLQDTLRRMFKSVVNEFVEGPGETPSRRDYYESFSQRMERWQRHFANPCTFDWDAFVADQACLTQYAIQAMEEYARTRTYIQEKRKRTEEYNRMRAYVRCLDAMLPEKLLSEYKDAQTK